MNGAAPINIRFGPYELDVRSAELRKGGTRVRLPEQPFQILLMLLACPGNLVTREEIRGRLWPGTTVVEFDHSINAAVKRLRIVLRESADQPRYIETLPRRGYRFIGEVESASTETIEIYELPTSVNRNSEAAVPKPRRAGMWAAAAVFLVIVLGATSWWLSRAHTSVAETGPTVVPLTTDPGLQRNPSFSPDGTQVVYEWDKGDENPHIYTKVVGPGDPVRLTSTGTAEYSPAWSPDGRQVAFVRKLDESTMGVFVISALGGVERKIAEHANPSALVLSRGCRLVDWTRDSEHLIVSGSERAGRGERLYLVSIAGGDKTWLTNPSGDSSYGDREPAVSPDGHTVAFLRGGWLASEFIHILPLSHDLRPSGEPQALESGGRVRSLAWTPDGREIIFTTANPERNFASSLQRIGLHKGATPRLLERLGRHAVGPAMTRSGRLAYSQILADINIWRQELPLPRHPVPPPVSIIASVALDMDPRYSPDGSRIAFQSSRSGSPEIWVCDSNGVRCFEVTTFSGPFITGSPRWSPDGKRLAFDSSRRGPYNIYVVDANGGLPQRVTDDSMNGIRPSWSHDRNWVYFSSEKSGRHEIWKTRTTGGVPLQVTHRGGAMALESPDGKALYYVDSRRDATLFRSALDGSGETEVLKGVAFGGFALAADRVYYLRSDLGGSVSIRCLRFAEREDFQIASTPKPTPTGLSLSPDGKYLLYSQLDQWAGNLMLVEDFR